MLRLSVFVVVFLSLCISVNAFSLKVQTPEPNYFPQQVGDEREYRKTRTAIGSEVQWTDRILASDGRFFQHSNYWGDGISRWLRVTSTSKVVEQTNRKPILWYKLGASEEREWTIDLNSGGPSCVDGALVKIVSTKETVIVPAGTFQNCLKLEFHSNCSDAGLINQWFAPEIGLVKQTEDSILGPVTSELVRAKIGTIIYPR